LGWKFVFNNQGGNLTLTGTTVLMADPLAVLQAFIVHIRRTSSCDSMQRGVTERETCADTDKRFFHQRWMEARRGWREEGMKGAPVASQASCGSGHPPCCAWWALAESPALEVAVQTLSPVATVSLLKNRMEGKKGEVRQGEGSDNEGMFSRVQAITSD
jgi:hypothetical protein